MSVDFGVVPQLNIAKYLNEVQEKNGLLLWKKNFRIGKKLF